MYSKEQGFILQSFASDEQKFSILTRTRGKLQVFIDKPQKYIQLRPGMLLAFFLQGERFIHVKEVEVLQVPIIESKKDIAWMHHLIELCSYFSQPELFDTALFDGLASYLMLLSHRKECNNGGLELLCVLHLLWQTGFYADALFVRYERLLIMITSLPSSLCFSEVLNDLKQSVNKLTLSEIKQIEFFIIQCLKKHPLFRMFKTVRFVYFQAGQGNNYDI